MLNFQPGYLTLLKTGELRKRAEKLEQILDSCQLCPRKCKVNRNKNEKGYCGAGKNLKIASFFAHFGEEKVLSGKRGSGTIFLSWCNLRCVFCQNYQISHLGEGREVIPEDCAKMMLELQGLACHNINFVSPTHFTPQIVKAIEIAANKGLNLPIVWNCSGYENVEIIKLLDGIVDIYMPDIKYGLSELSQKYSNAPDYFEKAQKAVKEMFRQVGDLKLKNGLAVRGLLVRHLILPNNLANSKEVFKFLAREISKNVFLNIMNQYYPCYQAFQDPEISRALTNQEYQKTIKLAQKIGLKRIYGI